MFRREDPDTMNATDLHAVRRRHEARRRIRSATAWTVAAGGLLASVFGAVFAGAGPAAAAAVPVVDPPSATVSPPTASPAVPPTARHRVPPPAALRPAPAPRPSPSGTLPHASSGAT